MLTIAIHMIVAIPIFINGTIRTTLCRRNSNLHFGTIAGFKTVFNIRSHVFLPFNKDISKDIIHVFQKKYKKIANFVFFYKILSLLYASIAQLEERQAANLGLPWVRILLGAP